MKRMPMIFAGHGSPMNIIEKNRFTDTWQTMANSIVRPRAILCISAHWFVRGQFVSIASPPETIHDFYGFPDSLYQVKYPAPGAPQLASRTASIKDSGITLSSEWGLDHGAWSVLHFMYPEADIPVCQLSVNADSTPLESYQIGQMLAPLREEGILIMGSGNIVHNLSLVNWDMPAGGYPWADEFDGYIRDAIIGKRHHDIINYQNAGTSAHKAFSQRDHYDPLLYVLGAATSSEPVQIFNDERVMGALSMTSCIIGD